MTRRIVGSALQRIRRAVPQLIPVGLGTRTFIWPWLENSNTVFLHPPTSYNPVIFATKYALQAEQNCIAQRLGVVDAPLELADAVCSESLHALSLDPFILPIAAKRNFLVMREISVVVSWMDPRQVVDLFFLACLSLCGQRQLQQCGQEKLSAVSQRSFDGPLPRPQFQTYVPMSPFPIDVELDKSSMGEKRKRNLKQIRSLAHYSTSVTCRFQLSDFFADLVHGNSTVAHRNQLCG